MLELFFSEIEACAGQKGTCQNMSKLRSLLWGYVILGAQKRGHDFDKLPYFQVLFARAQSSTFVSSKLVW